MRVHSQSPPGLLRLLPLAILLSSCASMSDSRGGGEAGQPPPAAPAAQAESPTAQAGEAGEAGQTGITAAQAAAAAAQLELINEINRDGARLTGATTADTGPQPVDVTGDNVVELNYEQADLRLVLEELAEALDISLVMDPAINRTVSLRTAEDRPLSREDIWPLMRLLTRDAGVVINRVGNVYNVRQVGTPVTTEFTTAGVALDSNAARIMQVTPADLYLGGSRPRSSPPLAAGRRRCAAIHHQQHPGDHRRAGRA